MKLASWLPCEKESHIYVCVNLISSMKFSVNFPTRDLGKKRKKILVLACSLPLRRGISQIDKS